MAYCVLADVTGMFPQFTFSVTTKPTTTQVQAEIDMAAAMMDAELAKVYTVPCDTTTGAETLKAINRLIAAAKVNDIIYGTTGGERTRAAADWDAQAQRALESIVEAETPVFQDATPATGAQPRLDAFPDLGEHYLKDKDGNEILPMMTREKKF